MKKILSLTLAALLLVSMIPTAMAADYTEGTQITLNGSGTESYTVTVPATLAPGESGTVKAEGTWAADKFLNVGVPSSVTLSYGAQTMDVAITGGSFSLIGNSVDQVSKEVEISVEDASRLFGTWTGVLEYDVALIEKGDVNRDGVIDVFDVTKLRNAEASQDDENLISGDTLTYGDVNGDGKIRVADVTALSQIVAGNYVSGAINGTAESE